MKAKTRILVLTLTLLSVALIGCESNDTYITGPDDHMAPATPRGVYSVTGDREVTVVWLGSDESDLAGYLVYRAPELEGPYDVIAEISAGDRPYQLAYTDRNVSNGHTYFYAVSSFDYNDNLSELSYEDVFDTPRPAGYGIQLYATEVQRSRSAFDFSRQARVSSIDPDADIFITLDGGALYVEVVDAQTDLQDFGYTETLDALDWAPVDGWSSLGWAELITGHTYAVWTRDDHYAKFRVTGMNGTSTMIDWAYQVDPGNPELKPAILPQQVTAANIGDRN